MDEYYCAEWDNDSQKYKEGDHGKLDEVVVEDGYFIASQLSQHLPDDQYVGERDLEGVDFTVDVSDSELTGDDVTSRSRSYLEKFPNIYVAVAKYVENVDEIPVGRIVCPHCGNDAAYPSDISDV